MKRAFDIFFSIVGLILLSPFLLLSAVLIKIDSRGPVFFKQERIGRNFVPFSIYKFRSMKHLANKNSHQITVSGDSRITRFGEIIRKLKIDEFPQLFNVLKGEMSFVGPRPEIKKYVDIFKSDYEKILIVQPGITDNASLKYSNEEKLLGQFEDWEKAYIEKILPDKIEISKHYIKNNNLFMDLKIIFKTILSK